MIFDDSLAPSFCKEQNWMLCEKIMTGLVICCIKSSRILLAYEALISSGTDTTNQSSISPSMLYSPVGTNSLASLYMYGTTL